MCGTSLWQPWKANTSILWLQVVEWLGKSHRASMQEKWHSASRIPESIFLNIFLYWVVHGGWGKGKNADDKVMGTHRDRTQPGKPGNTCERELADLITRRKPSHLAYILFWLCGLGQSILAFWTIVIFALNGSIKFPISY